MLFKILLPLARLLLQNQGFFSGFGIFFRMGLRALIDLCFLRLIVRGTPAQSCEAHYAGFPLTPLPWAHFLVLGVEKCITLPQKLFF